MKNRHIVTASTLAIVLTGGAIVGVSIADDRDGYHERGGRWDHSYAYADDDDRWERKEHGRYDRGHRKGRYADGQKRQRLAQFVERFDLDGDGSITQEEITQRQTDRMSQYDNDANGQLNLDEFTAFWVEQQRERMVDRFQRLDDDGNAEVTLAEFMAPAEKITSRLDRDGDGVLSAEELTRRARHR